MLAKLKLEHVGPAAVMDLDFAARLNLLTGDNGLGKSFILDCAWRALSGTWAGEPAWPGASHRRDAWITGIFRGGRGKPYRERIRFDLEGWTWGPMAGPAGGPNRFMLVENMAPRPRRPIPGLVLYARADGGFGVWDPARNAWRRKDVEREVPPFPLSFLFTGDQLWNGLSSGDSVLCNGLLRDWVSWQQQSAPEFQTLTSLLEVLSPGADEALKPGRPIRVNPRDARDVPTLDLPYGLVPLTHASAGVRRILALAYLLVWAWHEHVRATELREQPPTGEVVLLVDELEAHLHPRWQRLVLPALLQVVTKLRHDATIQLIAATHAPLMLASVEPEFDLAQDALFTLDLVRRDGGKPTVTVTKADWRPRGDANTWLISEVFDLKAPRSLQAEQAIDKATVALRAPNLPIEEVRRIHHELHRVLKDTDPFWPRWEARAKAAGIRP